MHKSSFPAAAALLLCLVAAGWLIAGPLVPDEEDEGKRLEREAKALFSSASARYGSGDLWQAALELIQIVDFYPSFSKFEDAVFLLAQCQYELEMYAGADRMYRFLLQSVNKTKLVPEALLGLQKVAYKRGDFPQSLKFYKTMEAHYTKHEGIAESRYIAEQTYFNQESYGLVHNVVPHIKEKSPFYPYALYTAGLAHLKEKNVREAISVFSKVDRLSDSGSEQAQIVSAARLTLGYVYFELSEFKAAAKYLLRVKPVFHGYPEALLTLGWAFLKLQDHKSALIPLNKLIRSYPDYYNLDEAHFLRGQSYLKLGYYDFAANEFDLVVPTDSSKTDTTHYESARGNLNVLEEGLEALQEELFLLETKLLESIPLYEENIMAPDLPGNMVHAKTELQAMLNNLRVEREDFKLTSDKIAMMRKALAKSEMRNKWEAYAEYGRVKALYVKAMGVE